MVLFKVAPEFVPGYIWLVVLEVAPIVTCTAVGVPFWIR
jgi:hypothetical protein